MKRALTEEEEKLTGMGLKTAKRELAELKESLAYNTDILELNKHKRAVDIKWAQFVADDKEREEKKMLGQIEKAIKEREQTINQLTDQLKNGVEVKNPTGV